MDFKNTKDEDLGLGIFLVIICILVMLIVGLIYKGMRDIQKASPQTAAQFSPVPPQ